MPMLHSIYIIEQQYVCRNIASANWTKDRSISQTFGQVRAARKIVRNPLKIGQLTRQRVLDFTLAMDLAEHFHENSERG